ncbi:MAG TPA: glycosyltransferase [Candidatus Acidoferrales bacterium]|nr:glycosyltransferase [Candidatus Acidoferrales bacterium]
MNPILILSHNTRGLTQRCVESCLAQDCGGVLIDLLDNDSVDGTYEWAKSIPHPRILTQYRPQIGVSAGWNVELRNLFDNEQADHVLVVNSDTVLPPSLYNQLLAYGLPFVTGVSVDEMEERGIPERKELVESPDFSCFLIRRDCWQSVGPFDESMSIYASDLDYHLRAWRAGLDLWNGGIPFVHERSSTLRLASPKDRRLIELQADADREAFYRKWGVRAGSKEYAALFDHATFGIDAMGGHDAKHSDDQ